MESEWIVVPAPPSGTRTTTGQVALRFEDITQDGRLLLEVLPNALSHGKTDPRVAYMLRWMAAKAAQQNFNPIYTIEA